MILKHIDYLLDMSLCYIACPLTGKLLCFDQSLILLLKQSCTLSQQLVLNHSTKITSVLILALHFTLRRLSSATILRLYALLKVTLIKFKQSFTILKSTKCGFARRQTQKELLLSRSLLLRYLLTALLNYSLNRNMRTSSASLA